MRDPSPELVRDVRRRAQQWGARRGLSWADRDELEGEILLWLAGYEPPEGWDANGAAISQLPWRLIDAARSGLHHRTRYPVTVVPVDATAIKNGAYDEPGYGSVEVELLLDAIPNPDEREAFIACATHGDAAALAERKGLDLSTIHKRASRARAHVLAAMEAT